MGYKATANRLTGTAAAILFISLLLSTPATALESTPPDDDAAVSPSVDETTPPDDQPSMKQSGRILSPLEEKFDQRRKRPSFQARLSGGMDLARPTYGVGGMVQVGAGFYRWVDVRFGVGFPGYFLVVDIEFNLYPYGRFVPTIGLRASFDPISAQETRAVEMNFGCEFWILDWLAAFIEVGLGMTVSHHDNFDPHFVAPAWIGVEMRY